MPRSLGTSFIPDRQTDVHQRQVEALPPAAVDRLLGGRGSRHLVDGGQRLDYQIPDIGLVVHHEDAVAFCHFVTLAHRSPPYRLCLLSMVENQQAIH